jgi:hypothetical protein
MATAMTDKKSKSLMNAKGMDGYSPADRKELGWIGKQQVGRDG